jgi:hypothetical protein
MNDCRHETSLWGRCTACGLTWSQQAKLREDEYVLSDEELRQVAEMPGRWSRPLAGEVLSLRARVAELEAETASLRDAGKDIGQHIKALNDIALDATGMHDVVGENRDGDWQAVWENVADLGADLRAARKRIAELEMQLRIERSSLGTPSARALRETVPIEVAQEIVRRANEKAKGGTDA